MPSVNEFELHPEDAQKADENLALKISDEYGKSTDDPVNHPKHYTHYKGVEVIQLTRQMNFNRGNAVKYIARAGLKDPSKEIEDLEKAAFYIQDEIKRLKDL